MNLVFYQFSRAKIEAGDFRHFLTEYDPLKMDAPTLKHLMGSLEFVIEGYDADPREVYEIPAVRQFFNALNRAWPYALYFCIVGYPEVRGAGLRSMALSCVPITTLRNDRTGITGVSYGPELVQWIAAGFEPMNRLFIRAGFSIPENIRRTDDLFAYFNLPR